MGTGGNLQFGSVCVLLPNPIAKLGVVPLCHSHCRLPWKAPKALRRPEIASPSRLATPRHTTIDSLMHNFDLGEVGLAYITILFAFPHA